MEGYREGCGKIGPCLYSSPSPTPPKQTRRPSGRRGARGASRARASNVWRASCSRTRSPPGARCGRASAGRSGSAPRSYGGSARTRSYGSAGGAADHGERVGADEGGPLGEPERLGVPAGDGERRPVALDEHGAGAPPG